MAKGFFSIFSRKKEDENVTAATLPQLIFDRENLQILHANEAAIKLYGYSLEEFRVMTIREIRPVWELDKLARHLQEQKMHGNNVGIWKHLKKNGEVMLVQVEATDVHYNGATQRMVTIKDITPLSADI